MASKKRCLLIVDDEPEIRELLRELAEFGLKCEVLEAENGVNALQVLQKRLEEKQPVDAILSDINMPKMNGLDFLKELRKNGDQTPFVVLTAHGDKSATITALQLGAFDFLDKPFDEQRLMRCLDSALDLGASFQSIEQELDEMVSKFNLDPESAAQFKNLKRPLLISKRKDQ